jgi:hypothetical protein
MFQKKKNQQKRDFMPLNGNGKDRRFAEVPQAAGSKAVQ